MFITCDSSCNMGYIYLMLDNYNIVEKNKKYIDKLKEKIGIQNFNIEILEDRDKKIENKLNSLKISSKTYKKLIKNSVFTEEYLNDKIKSGYIYGIELDLTEKYFIELLKRNSFKIYKTNWKNKEFDVVFLDFYEKIFDKKNIIYPLNNKKDVYIIGALDEKYSVITIKSLISSRQDLYPLEYLKKPLFLIR